jgi:hypothetical protein
VTGSSGARIKMHLISVNDIGIIGIDVAENSDLDSSSEVGISASQVSGLCGQSEDKNETMKILPVRYLMKN